MYIWREIASRIIWDGFDVIGKVIWVGYFYHDLVQPISD